MICAGSKAALYLSIARFVPLYTLIYVLSEPLANNGVVGKGAAVVPSRRLYQYGSRFYDKIERLFLPRF
jgi:hypothetical protein